MIRFRSVRKERMWTVEKIEDGDRWRIELNLEEIRVNGKKTERGRNSFMFPIYILPSFIYIFLHEFEIPI